ncbi:MAG: DUF460 domain-containing protein [Candidatus Aenigmarchaeota archaeon]|nr:DUF460 domain-containing protein [Candidatus Aenigmarchaeota archaeon]
MKLIVGIDPGITAAVAFLDAETDFYITISRRNFSFSEICETIAERGDPIIIAADTQHEPQMLRKISSTFGCRLHVPKKDMMIGEKKLISEGFGYHNDHERDALASAIHAKQEFRPLFEKIDLYLEKKGMKKLSPDVKELLVKGEAANIEQAVKMLTSEERKETRVVSRIIESKKVLELRQKIHQLEKGKNILENYAKHLEGENKSLKRKTEVKQPRDKEPKIRILEEALSGLRKERERLKNEVESYKNLIGKDIELVHVYEEGRDFSGKIVLAEGKFNRRALEKQNPKAIICDTAFPAEIPIIPRDKVKIHAIGNVLVVDKHELEKGLQESFIVWLKAYKERRAVQE